ncbi:hypothetical protein K1719_037230 [Acacia pycnantha]|nr:hypothetical protein K1719_037230 [Acacia pycnantha]
MENFWKYLQVVEKGVVALVNAQPSEVEVLKLKDLKQEEEEAKVEEEETVAIKMSRRKRMNFIVNMKNEIFNSANLR